MRRKFLSVLLAMAMVLTMVPVTALAADELSVARAEAGTDLTYGDDGLNQTAFTVTYGRYTAETQVKATVLNAADDSSTGVESNPITINSTSATSFKLDLSGLDAGSYKVKVADNPETINGVLDTLTIAKALPTKISFMDSKDTTVVLYSKTADEITQSPAIVVADAGGTLASTDFPTVTVAGVGTDSGTTVGTIEWYSNEERTTPVDMENVTGTVDETGTPYYWVFKPADNSNYQQNATTAIAGAVTFKQATAAEEDTLTATIAGAKLEGTANAPLATDANAPKVTISFAGDDAAALAVNSTNVANPSKYSIKYVDNAAAPVSTFAAAYDSTGKTITLTFSGRPTAASTAAIESVTITKDVFDPVLDADLVATPAQGTTVAWNIAAASGATTNAATLGNATITGTVGTALTEQTIAVTLAGDSIDATEAAKAASYTLNNAPAGVSIKGVAYVEGTKIATLTLQGTPTATADAAISLKVAGAVFSDTTDVTATTNASAKWAITEPAAPVAATIAVASVSGKPYDGDVIDDTDLTVALIEDGGDGTDFTSDATFVYKWEKKNGTNFTEVTEAKAAGTYRVTVSLSTDSAKKYTATPATSNEFTITPLSVTITGTVDPIDYVKGQETDREVTVKTSTSDFVAGDDVAIAPLKGTIASAYAGSGQDVVFAAGAKYTLTGTDAGNYAVASDGAIGAITCDVNAINQTIGAINASVTKGDTNGLDLLEVLTNAGAVLPSDTSTVIFSEDGASIANGKLVVDNAETKTTIEVAYTIPAVSVGGDATNEYNEATSKTFNVVVIDSTLATPTITFDSDAVTVKFGETVDDNGYALDEDEAPDAPLTVGWTSSDMDVATIDAYGVITLVGVGETLITAKVDAAAGQHNAAQASYTLKVEKGVITLTVTPATQSITVGDSLTTPFTIDPATGAYSGGTITYFVGAGDKGTTESTLDVGTYTVKIVGATANDTSKYDIETVDGTLTVAARAALSVPAVTIPAGTVGTDLAPVSVTISGGKAGYTLSDVTNVPAWLEAAISGSTLTISSRDGKRPDTAAAASSFTITVEDANHATVDVTVNVGAISTASSGSRPSGGSSGGGGGTSSSVTVPVSGDDHSVNVSAKVSGNEATIEKIDGLDKVIDSGASTGVVEIDLTALNRNIDTVKLPTNDLEDIADAAADGDNDVDGLSVKLDSGTVEFDVDALAAIASQATTGSIELKLEKTTQNSLNSAQKDAVADMEVHGHFDLTLNGGKVITDFKGGQVTVRIPFTVPADKDSAGFVVVYVANDGTTEEMDTRCSGSYITFTTGHFSKYLIVYKDSEAVDEPADQPDSATCDGGANCPANKFTDVNTDLWYHNAIDFVLTNGLMSGVGDSTFAPNANLSRAMLAQILYNQEGKPAVTNTSVFDDVAAGMWYTNAIAWAAENGVVSGLGDGKFGPNNNITREQLAVMLFRYAGSPSAAGGGSLDRFADGSKASSYAQEALVWATGMGIMNGKGGGMLDPQGQATRAEVAQMLYNYLNI